MPGGIEAQTKQALANLKAVVEASGSEVGKVVKTTVRTVNSVNVGIYERHNSSASGVSEVYE